MTINSKKDRKKARQLPLFKFPTLVDETEWQKALRFVYGKNKQDVDPGSPKPGGSHESK